MLCADRDPLVGDRPDQCGWLSGSFIARSVWNLILLKAPAVSDSGRRDSACARIASGDRLPHLCANGERVGPSAGWGSAKVATSIVAPAEKRAVVCQSA